MLTYVLLIATGRDYELAFNILLPSFFYFQEKNLIYNFIIIYKKNEKNLLDYWLNISKSKNYDFNNFTFICESDIISNIPKNTYYFQMYLKLYVHKIVEYEYYIVLDSDIFFCKKFNNSNFYDSINNKAYFKKEYRTDNWAKRCEKIYNIKLEYLFNQTPFVFRKSLLQFIFKKYQVKLRILKNNCSEYTLYQTILQKNNMIENNYIEHKFKEKSINYFFVKKSNNIEDDIKNKMKSIFNNYNNNIVVSGIQSRIKQNFDIYKILKMYIPFISLKKYKIAILTVVSGNLYYERYKEAIELKRNYCKYHNYDFIFNKVNDNYHIKNGWLKIYFMLRNLKKYDYIFMSDADVVITNKDKRIDDIINLYNCKDYCCLVTTDFNSLNTGNIIWRNCDKSIELLNKILELKDNKLRYSLKSPFIPKGIYEQPSFIYYYNKSEEYRKLIKIIPQFEMNSYTNYIKKINIIPKINNIINRGVYKNGDFLIHFAGFNYINKRKVPIDIDKLIKKYIEIYNQIQYEKVGSDYGKIK